jgi:hypothetical protein
MDRIKNKWDFLIQCRPSVKGMVGNAKLIGGRIDYNDNHDEIFNFITSKGTFSYNERTDEFKSKLQIPIGMPICLRYQFLKNFL